MEGCILFRDGTLVKGYAVGQPGLCMGRLARFFGGVDPHFVATDPAQRGLIIVPDSPELGSLGARALLDQSDAVQAASILCRNMVDFPSYRTSYRNINSLFSREGAFFISSLEMGPVLDRADRGEDAAAMAYAGNAPDRSAIEVIRERFDSYVHDGSWEGSQGAKRVIQYRNLDRNADVLVLDLGMRSGMLRTLRSHSNVTMLPPDPSFMDRIDRRFDAAFISNGPGAMPGEDLIETVRSFYEMTDNAPLFAMGIGALALNIVLGGTPDRLNVDHRSMVKNVLIGDMVLPTYQSHELHPGSLPGFEATCFGRDGMHEVLSGCGRNGRPVIMSMMDTLPEYGMIAGDPLLAFMRMAMEAE